MRESLKSCAIRQKTFLEAEFLDVISTVVLSLMHAIQSTLLKGFLPPPLEQNWFETGCNVNIVYGNLKSENSQDYALKPQRNCTFMNSASVTVIMDDFHGNTETGGDIEPLLIAPWSHLP
jgi:hypothetical protein